MKSEQAILKHKVDEYRSMGFEELQLLIAEKSSHVESSEVKNDDKEYQIEITIEWEDKENNEIRVVGFIENNKKKWWKNFISVSTVSYGFIITPYGTKD